MVADQIFGDLVSYFFNMSDPKKLIVILPFNEAKLA